MSYVSSLYYCYQARQTKFSHLSVPTYKVRNSSFVIPMENTDLVSEHGRKQFLIRPSVAFPALAFKTLMPENGDRDGDDGSSSSGGGVISPCPVQRLAVNVFL